MNDLIYYYNFIVKGDTVLIKSAHCELQERVSFVAVMQEHYHSLIRWGKSECIQLRTYVRKPKLSAASNICKNELWLRM